jgi:hypothetical protein
MAQDNHTSKPDEGADHPARADVASAQPTWKELAAFINQQSENDRKVIDFWFRLAASVIAILLLIVSCLGIKTLWELKEAAKAEAREAAKAKVEDVLRRPEIQILVQKTASDLFSRGVFRDEIEAKVREQTAAAIASQVQTPEFRKLITAGVKGELTTRMAPRLLTEPQRKAITDSLRDGPGGQVKVKTGPLPEQQAYAKKLTLAIKAAPAWRDRVSYAEPGTWAGLEDRGNLALEGIVIVVGDVANPPPSAHRLAGALRAAGITATVGACGCDDPPKPPDIWLYVGEKTQ